MSVPQTDVALVEQIRAGSATAWRDLIDRFEGRLLAYLQARLNDRAAAEDLVQETLVGFLVSLPHYDLKRPLENWLFSIAAHKLTDHLRRRGRRPTVALPQPGTSPGDVPLPGSQRRPSSLARSAERQQLEEAVLAETMQAILAAWRQRGDWVKIQCLELLLVRGWPNKQAAAALGLSEQQVANYKFDFLAKLQQAVRKHDLAAELIPEMEAPQED